MRLLEPFFRIESPLAADFLCICSGSKQQSEDLRHCCCCCSRILRVNFEAGIDGGGDELDSGLDFFRLSADPIIDAEIGPASRRARAHLPVALHDSPGAIVIGEACPNDFPFLHAPSFFSQSARMRKQVSDNSVLIFRSEASTPIAAAALTAH